jgi:hypothetical protein
MGLIYDDPKLAALTLMRITAEESEGPTELTGRMRAVMDHLVQRNRAGYLAELVIRGRTDLNSTRNPPSDESRR